MVKETRIPGKKHRPVTDKTLSHKVVSSTPHYNLARFELSTSVAKKGTDCTGSCKCNYHVNMTTTTLCLFQISEQKTIANKKRLKLVFKNNL